MPFAFPAPLEPTWGEVARGFDVGTEGADEVRCEGTIIGVGRGGGGHCTCNQYPGRAKGSLEIDSPRDVAD